MPTPFHDADVFVGRLARMARDGDSVAFLVGAPLTAPTRPGEPGVPQVAEMVRRARRELGRDPEEGAFDADAYQEALHALFGSGGADAVGKLVRRAVLEATDLEESEQGPILDGLASDCDALESDPSRWSAAGRH